jgi:c-di-GMP-related signal transduction protein
MQIQAVKAKQAIFVGRQPILDRRRNEYAYELLFRSRLDNCYNGADHDASTLDIIANSFVEIGLDDLTAGQRAFINFTRELLLKRVAGLVPNDQLTVGILRNVEPDEPVLEACRELKDCGYTLAVDDFVLEMESSPLLDLADIVKVDFRGTSRDFRKRIAEQLTRRGILPLAEKVETDEEFQEALADGYQLFQGYFFAKPVVRHGVRMTGSRLAQIQMLQEINRPEVSVEQLENIIKHDVSMTYKLLRFINSAWFGLRREIKSIRHALTWLGTRQIRNWVALVTLRDMGAEKPPALILQGLTRAKMAEELGVASDQFFCGEANFFLLGMLSILDALLDLPMAQALEKLPLDRELRGALLGEPGMLGAILEAVVAYEAGDWKTFSAQAQRLGIDEMVVPAIFRQATHWANQVLIPF